MFVSEAKISLISSSKRLVTTGWHDFVSINEETQKLSEPIDFNLYLHVYCTVLSVPLIFNAPITVPYLYPYTAQLTVNWQTRTVLFSYQI